MITAPRSVGASAPGIASEGSGSILTYCESVVNLDFARDDGESKCREPRAPILQGRIRLLKVFVMLARRHFAGEEYRSGFTRESVLMARVSCRLRPEGATRTD